MSLTLKPPYDEWGATLASNDSVARALHSVLGAGFVAAIRREILQVATQYRSTMQDCARRLGISLPRFQSRDGLIVMAGHQPVVYHPGIVEKTRRLGALVRETGAYALNVAIDTDEGDGGRLLWPLRDGDDVVIQQRSIATRAPLYRDQVVVSKEESASIFAEMRRDLGRSGCARAVAGAERAERLYGDLEGESIVLANAIVRKHLCEGTYDEMPLSLLLEAPSVHEFIQRIVRDAERFVEVYNYSLDRYRLERKIKNPANPFPNMGITDDEIELPLWEIVGSSRKGLFVARGSAPNIPNLLAPRGSIVTLLLRGVCSDLFIHGLGGGKYDLFVNAFAEAYWGCPLPNFVVASATQYLFPGRVERYIQARHVKERYKEMVSHTAQFMGTGLFSQDDESAFAPFLERRSELLPRMQTVQSKEERSAIAHELNEVNRRIKAAIDTSSLAPLLAEGAIDDARLNHWACREYPFFLFAS